MTPQTVRKIIMRSKRIEGWFMPGAAYFFALLNHIQKQHGITGSLFEIGVHHGKSTIMLGSMTEPTAETLGACDLFGSQSFNVSGSGKADKEIFLRNVESFFPKTDFLRIFEKPSANLSVDEIGSNYRFFHIDGGHSLTEALNDLELAASALNEKGLIVLDDAFNAAWPGVSEAFFVFLRNHPDQFSPVVVGFNKLVLTRRDARKFYFDAIGGTDTWRFIPREPYELKQLELCGDTVHVFFVPSRKRENSLRSKLYQWYFQNPLLRDSVLSAAIKTLKRA